MEQAGRVNPDRLFLWGGLSVPYDIRHRLEELRKLRSEQRRHAQLAENAMGRATVAMSTKRAIDRGGTGTCPLTEYAPVYAQHRDYAREAGEKADGLWRDVQPYVCALPDLDARIVVTGYYQQADSWEDVRRNVKRSESSVFRLNREAIRAMERM